MIIFIKIVKHYRYDNRHAVNLALNYLTISNFKATMTTQASRQLTVDIKKLV